MTRALVLFLLPALAVAEPQATATRDSTGHLLIELAGVPDVPASSIVLNIDNTRWILPETVTPFESTDQRVALAVVMQVSQPWIDREDFQIATLFDKRLRQLHPPPGSTLAIVTYASFAEVRLAPTAFTHIPILPFGTQAEHRGKTGNALVAGITLGLAELAKSDAPIKQLVVIGDGTDAEPSQPHRMRALAEDGIRAGVQMHAIVLGYDSGKASEPIADHGLEPTAMAGNWTWEADARLREILVAIAQRRTLVFAKNLLPADGRVHALELEIGAMKIPFDIAMPDARLPDQLDAPAAPARIPWHVVLGAGAFAALGLAILLVHRRRIRCSGISA